MIVVLGTFSVAACAEQPMEPQPERESWLLADLRGAVDQEHESDAEFNEGGLHLQGVEMAFLVSSAGAEDAHGRWSNFRVVRYGDGRPAPGSYPLERFDLVDSGASGILMQYTLQDGEEMRQWTSTAGTLEITASSEERVEGRFEFTGIECGPRDCATDPTTIQVSGSFSASPHDPTGGVALSRD